MQKSNCFNNFIIRESILKKLYNYKRVCFLDLQKEKGKKSCNFLCIKKVFFHVDIIDGLQSLISTYLDFISILKTHPNYTLIRSFSRLKN